MRTLRIVWALGRGRALLPEIQEACGEISPGALHSHLQELLGADLLALRDGGYILTDIGWALRDATRPLAAFAETWLSELTRRPLPE